MKKIFLAILSTIVSFSSHADEASVKALILKKYPSMGGSFQVKRLDVGSLYEINLLGQEAYTNEKVDFLFVGGSLIDAAKLEDVTAKRKSQFLRDFFAGLPKEHAIKTSYGKGERVFISFEDPDCPICKVQHAEWAKNPEALNATVYTFVFPLNIHPDAKRKSEYIWCQKDPGVAWKNWMTTAQGLPLDAKGVLVASFTPCKAGVEHVMESERLARSMGYHETPRFIFANGKGAARQLSHEQFLEALGTVEKELKEVDDKKGQNLQKKK